MNILRLYPEKIRKIYVKNIKNSGVGRAPEDYNNFVIKFSIISSVFSLVAFYFLEINLFYSILVFFLLNIFFHFRISLKSSARKKRMEEIFPDVISLMASNLRSGITVDRAFLLSARPEFAPLDKEILETGKEITTGKDVVYALEKMMERIDSEKISKIILLIISGLKAGGNISSLLEETSRNMKEKAIIEKKAASNITMYVIFIFFAVSIGAPLLFGLSSVLVSIVLELTSRMPPPDALGSQVPFTFSSVSISPRFVLYFSLLFILVTDLISSLVIGLVNKGEGKAGLRYFIPLVLISFSVFFVIKSVLSKVLLKTISSF